MRELIAIGGHVIESDVQPAFWQHAHVVTLPIDDAIFSSPPAAWQSLDGVLLDAANAAKLDDTSPFGTACGRCDARCRPRPPGPMSVGRGLAAASCGYCNQIPLVPATTSLTPMRSARSAAIPPGLSSDGSPNTRGGSRWCSWRCLIAARFVRMAAAISARRQRADRSHFRLSGDTRGPRLSSGQGEIVVIQSSTLQRQDTWLYEVGRTQRVHSVPWSGFTRAGAAE